MKISIIKNSPSFVKKLLVAAFWVLVWQLVYMADRQEIRMVSPVRVLQRLTELAADGTFWLSALTSMQHIVLGFLLGVALGVVLSALASFLPLLKELLNPVISIVRATPVASFILLALVWIRSGGVPVFISFLMVLPVVWGNVIEGIAKTSPSLLEMAEVFRFGPFKTIKAVYIPSVMPYFTAACTTALGLAWKAGIAAEVLVNAKNSIGGNIYDAKIYIETADLFAWTLVVILLSVALERLMLRLMRLAGKHCNA